MSTTSGMPHETQSEASSPPVILPMGLARGPSAKPSVDCRPNGQRRAAPVARFAFPAVQPRTEEPSAVHAPGAIWPRCDCTEEAAAGVKLADAIGSRLSAGRSSVIAVTSPGNGDGKTRLVTVLAPELRKRTDEGVLAVDGDFRKADLTSLLTLAASRTPDGSPLVYPTDLPGLSVLPRPPGLEWQYLDAAWIEQLREGWPLVILDLASLEYPETVSVLKHCDGVCLVVRLGHTARRAVREAGRVISAAGGRLWGSIVVGQA
jgi:Mrp family chromosome partitioning ATPase